MIIMSREFRQTIFSYRIVHLDLHNRLLDPQSGGGLRGNVSLSPTYPQARYHTDCGSVGEGG